MEKQGEWIDCVADNDYEIFTDFPYQIRKKSNKKIIRESVHKYTGYVICNLNLKMYRKHRIIAQQFIYNDDPETKTFIDHINHIKTDNRIENLRWCSPAENNNNRSTHNKTVNEYFDEINEDSIEVREYSNHKFEDYYYDDQTDAFYFWNGLKFRKLRIFYTKYDKAFVNMKDINNKRVRVFYSAFKKQYDLI